jgi:hypothetical protein
MPNRNEADGSFQVSAVRGSPQAADGPRILPAKSLRMSGQMVAVIKRWLREPLLHFMLIAGVLFAAMRKQYEVVLPASNPNAIAVAPQPQPPVNEP